MREVACPSSCRKVTGLLVGIPVLVTDRVVSELSNVLSDLHLVVGVKLIEELIELVLLKRLDTHCQVNDDLILFGFAQLP